MKVDKFTAEDIVKSGKGGFPEKGSTHSDLFQMVRNGWLKKVGVKKIAGRRAPPMNEYRITKKGFFRLSDYEDYRMKKHEQKVAADEKEIEEFCEDFGL